MSIFPECTVISAPAKQSRILKQYIEPAEPISNFPVHAPFLLEQWKNWFERKTAASCRLLCGLNNLFAACRLHSKCNFGAFANYAKVMEICCLLFCLQLRTLRTQNVNLSAVEVLQDIPPACAVRWSFKCWEILESAGSLALHCQSAVSKRNLHMTELCPIWLKITVGNVKFEASMQIGRRVCVSWRILSRLPQPKITLCDSYLNRPKGGILQAIFFHSQTFRWRFAGVRFISVVNPILAASLFVTHAATIRPT